MQYLNTDVRRILGERLKVGHNKPKCRVEVDKLTFIPGNVKEVSFYETDMQKVKTQVVVNEGSGVTTQKGPATFPFKGLTYADKGSKWALTSPYGPRWGKHHNGTDLQNTGSSGTVVAMWDGKVTRVGSNGTAGNVVYILVDNSILVKYFHLASWNVKVGDQVKAGQQVGIEGATGGVTGRHLHVEIWLGAKSTTVNGNDTSGCYHVDPDPYLKGQKGSFNKTSGTKTKTQTTTVTGTKEVKKTVPGKEIWREDMKSPTWWKGNMYEITGPDDWGTDKNDNGRYRITFNYSRSGSNGIGFRFQAPKKGKFTFHCASNFSAGDGDKLYIYVNSKLHKTMTGFQLPGSGVTKIEDIPFDKGSVYISLVSYCAGRPPSTGGKKKMRYYFFKAMENDETITETVATSEEMELEIPDNNAVMPPTVKDLESLVFSEKKIQVNLKIGSYAYTQTLVLDNVSSVEIDRNYEAECTEAKVTISNLRGFYSPDYNPYYFPETSFGENNHSPFSTITSDGLKMGVFSENTPIRIDMGYGDYMFRMFTGLIDQTDINGTEGTLTVSARDMYKRIVEQVLLNRKEYPPGASDQKATAPVTAPPGFNPNSLPRLQQIYYHAWNEAVNVWKLPENSYYFLLAICRHETQFGTAGQGKEPKNMVLGYGSFDSNPDFSYGGIQKQMYYGAKRVAEALKSKGYVPKSYNDVSYFWKGGDKGRYQWATDTNWPNSVWRIYQAILGKKGDYKPPSTAPGTAPTANQYPYPGSALKQGSTGTYVKQAQSRLGVTADGIFGAKTKSAVVAFQKKNNIVADGIIGPVTWGKLFPPPTAGAAPAAAKAPEKIQFLKTAIIQDLVSEAGLYGWRRAASDLPYPDAVVQESYLIEVQQKTGKVVKFLPENKATLDKKFETVAIESVKAPEGWMNPFVEAYGTMFLEHQWKVGDAINELIKETNYRSYCDRFGTYRLELIDLDKPVVATFRNDDNLISINKTLDWSRARSHIIIYDDGEKGTKKATERGFASLLDKEIMHELKGELRTGVAVVPWARSNAQKREVAKKMFWDMKRLSRSLQVSIPGNPALDILDHVRIYDSTTSTTGEYIIKSIKDSFEAEGGYLQVIELMWHNHGNHMVNYDTLIWNPEVVPDKAEPPKVPAKPPCTPYPGYVMNIDKNNRGTNIKLIQAKLNEVMKSGLTVDGVFGKKTDAAVRAFQRKVGINIDGDVGPVTWQKLFCPTAPAPKPPAAPTKVFKFSPTSTKSWRDNWSWRTDNDYLYQGEWDNWGHNKGLMFFNSTDIRNKLKGKTIKSVRIYMERLNQGGVISDQTPTFWLHNYDSKPSGQPYFQSGTNANGTGYKRGEKAWSTLPVSYGNKLRDGQSKGIGIYVSGRSPYIYFYGKSKIVLEITTN